MNKDKLVQSFSQIGLGGRIVTSENDWCFYITDFGEHDLETVTALVKDYQSDNIRIGLEPAPIVEVVIKSVMADTGDLIVELNDKEFTVENGISEEEAENLAGFSGLITGSKARISYYETYKDTGLPRLATFKGLVDEPEPVVYEEDPMLEVALAKALQLQEAVISKMQQTLEQEMVSQVVEGEPLTTKQVREYLKEHLGKKIVRTKTAQKWIDSPEGAMYWINRHIQKHS